MPNLTQTPSVEALEALAARGAHFVLCGPSKKALSQGWQKHRPDLEAVIAHVTRGGLVGVIPSSVGCVVVDVDVGAAAGCEAVKKILGPPVASTRTKRIGGHHLWFRSTGAENNRKWSLAAGRGDVRGGRGYAVLWHPAQVAAGLEANYDSAEPVDLSLLAKPKRGAATGPEAVAKALPGTRNETLNLEVFKAASSGSLDEPAIRDAALKSGLPPGEVENTIASAKAGARATAPKAVTGDLDAKHLALLYAAQWGEHAAHSLGLGWFVRENDATIWTEDAAGVRIRCSLRCGLTGPESPAKRGTRTRDVEQELRDELDVPADRWDWDGSVLGLPDGRVWDVARGVPREARPDEFISQRLGALPEPGEPAVWLQHLSEVFAAHPQTEDVIRWLRWWFRYSLGTSCTDESIVFLDGPPGAANQRWRKVGLRRPGRMERFAEATAWRVTGNNTSNGSPGSPVLAWCSWENFRKAENGTWLT